MEDEENDQEEDEALHSTEKIEDLTLYEQTLMNDFEEDMMEPSTAQNVETENKSEEISMDNKTVKERVYSCVCLLGKLGFSAWKLCQKKIPAEAWMNNLELVDIPEELRCLNILEEHLISINIPFMKMLALPRGGQNGVHGPVVCVPSNITKTLTALPRCNSSNELIRVKLKRKLTYKGYYQYQLVSKDNVENALHYLKANNIWYKDIVVNKEWQNPLLDDDHKLEEQDSTTGQCSDEESGGSDDETDDRLCGIPLDTCLQPVDIGQEVLDQHFDDVLNVAPCEGNNPVRVLMEEGNEAKCFPALFPSGTPIFNDDRPVRITLSRYFLNRLMNADNRFAKNIQYIFYAQYLSEVQNVMSKVSIAMRQSSGRNSNIGKLGAGMIKDKDQLNEILQSDSGYKFLKPIRGTPPYWQSAQRDVMAMIRQLGIPTWFCSFSSADMRWPEVINTLLRQQGDSRTIEDLDWNEKCLILRSNPVTVARMFDRRFHTFLKDVILSPANPVGKVKDYFYRVEFQQRGSPHTHCLFWIENAPRIEVDTDDEVVTFIDRYVSCKLPSKEEHEELNDIVSHVQLHSRKHSKSCKKKGTECRFNFPRPPSVRTFISKPDPSADYVVNKNSYAEENEFNNDNDLDESGRSDNDGTENVKEDVCIDVDESGTISDRKKHDEAKELLKSVWEAIQDKNNANMSALELFKSINIMQTDFEKANDLLSTKTSIIMKRDPQDVWVNQYNPDLIRCWNANMDIQYICDEYACAAYVVSYMSKSEREMGQLLSHTLSEARKGNLDARKSMKELGCVYLHNREVSAQEAVFRVCSLRLKEGSRKVEFIPVGESPVRMSLPLSVIQKKSEDDDDIFMKNRVDRYKARPDTDTFENMCLATFCSHYRIIYSADTCNKSKKSRLFTLKNGLGHIQKRSRTEPAVIRYPRFSITKYSEKYYHSLLQLFLPHLVDAQLKPEQFETYEDFYRNGAVCLNGDMVSVSVTVEDNRSKYEKNAESLEAAEKYVEKFGVHEDAWALICPTSEQERLECERERKPVEEDDEECDIPDLQPDNKERTHNIEPHSAKISKQDALLLLRSLNEQQRNVFNKIRDWCLQKVNGESPEPFHVFLTGGAGTGKSHLIKCVYYEATRLFSKMNHNPDNVSVLITAPTGVAAFNINGSTIHSALSIPTDARLPYQPLGIARRSSSSSVTVKTKRVQTPVSGRALLCISGDSPGNETIKCRERSIGIWNDNGIIGSVQKQRLWVNFKDFT
ncbi:uncharacterized protein LOC119733831 [Patiria miniata]|uniref:ATP-dependent DNA helicase n=1 Tax=Patiria miniata TaxID=46514 RepID=A0A914AIA9_PATMI|nr:uncharacterized protein LOC119733831 [Patiria miniata]